MKVSIIGAGLIGCERIMAVKKISEEYYFPTSMMVYDPDTTTLEKIKNKYNVPTVDSLEVALQNKPDWVFVCTPHNAITPIIKQAFEMGSNVFVEKPLGRSLQECRDIINLKPENCKLQVGFNYRFFAGVEALLQDCKNNKFGKLISVNMILAHGNAPGMEKSWKLDPIKCGGGCLIDPGVHLLDLILEISDSELVVDCARSWSGFWNTGIEEEAHILMHNSNNTIFNTQISLNKWRSTFKLEVNGTEGYGIVEGRGRSYGPQSYRTGVRWGWQSGKSQQESEKIVVYKDPCEDSFIKDTFIILNQSHTANNSNYSKSLEVMKLLELCKTKINSVNISL